LRLFLFLFLTFLFGCGGGGSGQQTVSGQFISSYVEGLRVCSDIGCSYTDKEGKFTVPSDVSNPILTFYIGNLKLGSYRLLRNGEVVNPFKVAGSSNIGDKVAKVIHGVAADVNGTEEFIDLSSLSVSSDLDGTSVVDALRENRPFRIDVFKEGNSYAVVYNGTEVELCQNGTCRPVNYRQWLVLIYMMGDNSLSGNAVTDLKEMASVNYTPQVKLVAITDFMDAPDEISISNDTTGKLESHELGYELDLSEENSLKDFILEYWSRYPAKHVALIFWDHGDGWRSVKSAGNDSSSSDYLFMCRVYNALSELQNNYTISFDLIGFDECLMGMVEVLYDVGSFTRNVVASEGYEPADGWDYSKILSYLLENPDSDGYSFGRKIVDAYRETYGNSNSDYTLTLSLFERSRIDGIISNLNALSEELNSSNFQDFKLARENSVQVACDSESDCSYYYIDLYSFASSLSESYTEAENIVNLIGGSYKAVIQGSDGKDLHGLSIYFPSNSTEADKSWFDCYRIDAPSVCFFGGKEVDDYFNPFARTNWDEFLTEFITYSGD